MQLFKNGDSWAQPPGTFNSIGLSYLVVDNRRTQLWNKLNICCRIVYPKILSI